MALTLVPGGALSPQILAINSKVSPTSSQSQTSSDSSEHINGTLPNAEKKKTKLVVRRIPSFVAEQDIMPHLSDFSSHYDWFHFCRQPEIPNPTRRNTERYSRLYINFTSFTAAVPFIAKFQKLEFFKKAKSPQTQKSESKSESQTDVDSENESKVSESEAVSAFPTAPSVGYGVCVEFAPSQCVPRQSRSPDRRVNSISKDADYIAFLSSRAATLREHDALREKVEAESMRSAANIMDHHNAVLSEANKKERMRIAPLAKHVATHSNRRQLRAKKISRASLVKSERAKERELRRLRRRERRERKYGKYRPRSRDYDVNGGDRDAEDGAGRRYRKRGGGRGGRGRGRGRTRPRGKGRRGRGGRGRGRGRERERGPAYRRKVNPKYLKKYGGEGGGDGDRDRGTEYAGGFDDGGEYRGRGRGRGRTRKRGRGRGRGQWKAK